MTIPRLTPESGRGKPLDSRPGARHLTSSPAASRTSHSPAAPNRLIGAPPPPIRTPFELRPIRRSARLGLRRQNALSSADPHVQSPRRGVTAPSAAWPCDNAPVTTPGRAGRPGGGRACPDAAELGAPDDMPAQSGVAVSCLTGPVLLPDGQSWMVCSMTRRQGAALTRPAVSDLRCNPPAPGSLRDHEVLTCRFMITAGFRCSSTWKPP